VKVFKKIKPIDEMDKLINIINHSVESNKEIPQDILFKLLPKLNLLNPPLEPFINKILWCLLIILIQ
jgi:hypothetical protein